MTCVADATASSYTHNILEFIMNDRIQQLAEQAGYKDLPTVRLAFYGFDKEKFAELIVAEMCGLMEQAEDDAYHCSEPAERPTEYIEWLVNWRAQFEKHFGVEE